MLKRKLSILTILIISALAVSACDSPTETDLLNTLFTPSGFSVANPGQTTYVIWVNGDAEHFVPESSTDSTGKLERADAVEVQRMEDAAAQCSNCNVLLLHVQRGGEKWYTSSSPWATYFRVFVRGQKVLERSVPLINSADPALISSVLRFSGHFFSDTETHFMYRGHGFIPAYDAGIPAAQQTIAPFAYGHPESSYGPEQFVQGFAQAGLSRPLASITLAACSMADLALAASLAPYAGKIIAPEVDILETLDVSFDYTFINDSPDARAAQNPELGTAYWIASRLMKRFADTSNITEALMEYPVSLIDSAGVSAFDSELRSLLAEVPHPSPAAIQASRLSKQLSERYVASLVAKGETPTMIHSMETFIQSPSDDSQAVDVGLLLDQLVISRSEALRAELGRVVTVFDSSPVSPKGGLSARLDDLGLSQVPSQ